MTLNRKKVIQILQDNKKHLKDDFGFDELMLFGSFAKDTSHLDSDIDIAVKLDSKFKTLANYINAQEYLSSLLDDKKIDLVYYNPEFLNPIIKNSIDEERIIIE